MLIKIEGILNTEQLKQVHQLIGAGQFIDGRKSAGKIARQQKNNQELSLDETRQRELNNIVMGSLVKHPVYQSAAMPYKTAAPYYARYAEGMAYGNHVDDPVMGQGDLYRSDLSITIFLNSPDEYDGGELAIQTAFGEQQVKLPAGDAVLYPSSSLHRVTEITQGTRLVAVSWIQSTIRGNEQRALLHDLNQAREKLLNESPDAKETAWVNQSYINLVRMWSEI